MATMMEEVLQQPAVLADVRKYYSSPGAIPIKLFRKLVRNWPPLVVFTGMGSSLFAAYPAGWVTDRTGYRYERHDPESGRRWPPMPAVFADLAVQAAARAGFDGFAPDACLVNRYVPGARLSLHQDRNERDLEAPIVSVSLGLPALFLFGGGRRADTPRRVPLAHGDVVVWGGPARLRYHGVLPLEEGYHPFMAGHRINLTFRKAT